VAEELTFFGELARVVNREPFEPFILRITDGREYHIGGLTTLTLYATFVSIQSLSGIICIPAGQISGFEVPEPLPGDEEVET
jgi:hypothetical protein